MRFRLVPKSVTLNDPERRNGRYFARFQRIRVASGALRKSSRSVSSSPDEFLFYLRNQRHVIRYRQVLSFDA